MQSVLHYLNIIIRVYFQLYVIINMNGYLLYINCLILTTLCPLQYPLLAVLFIYLFFNHAMHCNNKQIMLYHLI